MSHNRDEGGKFTQRVTDADVLRALREHPDPVATAGDLSDTLGVTSETVRRRLDALQEQNAVERKSVGARAVVWWPADRGDASTATDADSDPFLSMDAGASGTTDVSENADEHLADAIAGDSASTDE